MTGQLQSPPPAAISGPAENSGRPAGAEAGTAAPAHGPFRHALSGLRKVSVFAPFAAAYGTFQAILSSLPPSLSDSTLHYLFAVAAGLAAGGLSGSAILLAWRSAAPVAPDALAAAPIPAAGLLPVAGCDIRAVFAQCQQELLGTVVSYTDPQLGSLTGWPHYFHEASARLRPTAYGTAYGLKLSLTLGSQDGRLNRAELAETLWKLRRSDGGWSSRSQGTVSRPEVTAVVLGALATAGCDAGRIGQAGDAFEAMLAPDSDPGGMTSTFIVASAIRELVRIRPSSTRLSQLSSLLVNGTVRDPGHENMLCWAARLDRGSTLPSAAHTALAILALARNAQVSGPDRQVSATIEQAARWLVLTRRLDNQTDQIRRQVTADHTESLTVNLFTAAWTARALLSIDTSGIPGADSALADAIATVIARQSGGIWEWTDGTFPLWMTYQGISTLQGYALSRWS